MDWSRLLNAETLPLLIPIVAIIMGGIFVITKAITHHRERMAMIERGMDPNSPKVPPRQ